MDLQIEDLSKAWLRQDDQLFLALVCAVHAMTAMDKTRPGSPEFWAANARLELARRCQQRAQVRCEVAKVELVLARAKHFEARRRAA